MAATAEITRFVAAYGFNARDHDNVMRAWRHAIRRARPDNDRPSTYILVDTDCPDWNPDSATDRIANVFVVDRGACVDGTLMYQHTDPDTAWMVARNFAHNLGKLEVYSA